MRLLVLFMCILNFICGKITKQMILNANKKIFKNNDLEMTILNPFFGYVYKNTNTLLDLRQFYHGINPIYKDKIKRDYTKDRSTDIFSKILIKLFLSSDENLSINDSIAQEYFSKQESKSKNIRVVSHLFIYLLKKDTISFPQKQKGLTREKMLLRFQNFLYACNIKYEIIEEQILGSFQDEFDSIYDEGIADKEETRSDILLTLHAFMLEVLNTEEEFIIYVTYILEYFDDEDEKILRTSDIYAFKLKKGEVNFNKKYLLNKLYYIPDKHCLRRFYDVPSKGNFIPYYIRSENRFDESFKFEDSVETALLYLCNYLFYNEEKEQYDVEHLKLDKDSNLLKFYTKYKTPFYINTVTRNEWSKVVQCLDDIDCRGLYNQSLGKICYINKSARNKLEPFIFNIITVLTRICLSSKNEIKKRYIELFDTPYKVYEISSPFQTFIQLLANKDVNIKCRFENLVIEKNELYAEFYITSSPEKDERLKTDIKVCLQPQLYKNRFYNSGYSYAEFQYIVPFISKELPKILYEINECEELTSLKCLICRYIDYSKLIFPYELTKNNYYGLFDKNLLINYFSKEDYLHYLFNSLNGTERDSKIFNIIKMIVKSALKDKNERYSDLRPFYIKIYDLKNDLSPKEIFDIWIDLLHKSKLFKSNHLLKLWTEEVKKITVLKEFSLPCLQNEGKIYFALETLKGKNVRKLEIASENLSINLNIILSKLKDYHYLKELSFKSIYFNDSQIKELCKFLLTKKIISLELSDCDLTDNSVEIIAETISNKINNLRYLNIEKNLITSKGAKFIADAFESKNNKLISLNISKNKLRTDGANYIIDALKRHTYNMSSLNIGENHFTFENISSNLNEVLFRRNSNLQHLDLSNTDFNEKDLQIISEYFESSNNDLRSLKMCSYHKTSCVGYSTCLSRDKALQYLCNALKYEDNNLLNLDISSFDFTLKGINFIAEALKSYYNELKSLNLSKNDFNEESANLIADSIADIDCKLEKLDLSYCDTFVEDFKRVFEVIFEGKTNIKVLKIKQSDFNTRSYDYVIELIQKYSKKIVSISYEKTSKFGDKIEVCCFISQDQRITFVV